VPGFDDPHSLGNKGDGSQEGCGKPDHCDPVHGFTIGNKVINILTLKSIPELSLDIQQY
jgi:hypothetical protein